MKPNALAIRLGEDLDSIAEQLIKAFELKHDKHHENLSSPMMRWLDFRLRYIPPQPRQVVKSDQFPKALPADIEEALHNLEESISSGGNLNAHQGKGLTMFHDFSGKSRAQRTDHLWADWGIHHLHIGSSLSTDGTDYSQRSNWLLFCMVLDEVVLFIDVLPHATDNFSEGSLLETTFRNWPMIAEQFELKGISAGRSFTNAETATLRKAGVAAPFTYQGKLYMAPGFGVTSAATPLRVTLVADKCSFAARSFAEEPGFSHLCSEFGINEPDFSLRIIPDGLALLERKSLKAWVLPRRSTCGEAHDLGALHDDLVPEWALTRIQETGFPHEV